MPGKPVVHTIWEREGYVVTKAKFHDQAPAPAVEKLGVFRERCARCFGDHDEVVIDQVLYGKIGGHGVARRHDPDGPANETNDTIDLDLVLLDAACSNDDASLDVVLIAGQEPGDGVSASLSVVWYMKGVKLGFSFLRGKGYYQISPPGSPGNGDVGDRCDRLFQLRVWS